MAYQRGFKLNLLQGDIFSIQREDKMIARFYTTIINAQLNLNLKNGQQQKDYFLKMGILNPSDDTEIILGLLIVRFSDISRALRFADSLQALARIRNNKHADMYPTEKVIGLVQEQVGQKQKYFENLHKTIVKS